MPAFAPPAAAALLRPDWAAPATWLPQLATHLAEGRGALHLDALGDDPPAPVVHAMLVELCGTLCPDRPLPEIVVHDDPAELAAVGELPPPAAQPELAAEPAAALEHARAVKRIADAARAHVERHRFRQAPPASFRDPLVTVRIPTWRGVETLMRRTLPSVVGGAYQRLEILVCSDGPDPAARAAVEELGRRDPRVRYLEVPERPVYPEAKINLHRVGGGAAANATLDAARGDFHCPLDHDDAFTYDHVVTLLTAAERSGCDFVYGQSVCEREHGVWALNGIEPLQHGGISHGSVLTSSRLEHLRYDADAWLLPEPGDWNMWRRMVGAGAAATLVRSTVLVHFAERTAIDSVDVVPPEPSPAEALEDLRRTGASWLLRVPLP